MARPATTIYDVAREAGVSIATVSRVLNNPQKVTESTRSDVLKTIEQLGFVPKAEARARAQKSTKRIGVVTPFLTAPAYVQRLRGVATTLANHNYELVIYSVGSLDQLNSYLGATLLGDKFDGLIVISLQLDNKLVHRILKQRIETVLIENHHPLLSTVEIDNLAGGRMAAEYLLKKGHQRCAFVGDKDIPEYVVYPTPQRLYGFRQVLSDANVALPSDRVCLVPYDMEAARQSTKGILQPSNHPTAIFAATDLQALGVMRAARDLGLKVPQDLAVIGFDDLDMADYVGLTTICQHLDESGRIAVELLLGRLSDPSRPPQHIHLALSVIERETA